MFKGPPRADRFGLRAGFRQRRDEPYILKRIAMHL